MPNECYQCIYRRNLEYSCHSRCVHPEAIESTGKEIMKIKGAEHGIKNGWFNWPYNFDPVWLEHCDGFYSKEKDELSNSKK